MGSLEVSDVDQDARGREVTDTLHARIAGRARFDDPFLQRLERLGVVRQTTLDHAEVLIVSRQPEVAALPAMQFTGLLQEANTVFGSMLRVCDLSEDPQRICARIRDQQLIRERNRGVEIAAPAIRIGKLGAGARFPRALVLALADDDHGAVGLEPRSRRAVGPAQSQHDHKRNDHRSSKRGARDREAASPSPWPMGDRGILALQLLSHDCSGDSAG
ncbi:MAG TPA: hypothetical protein VIX73_14215 [Kofleriaceae bacterium]